MQQSARRAWAFADTPVRSETRLQRTASRKVAWSVLGLGLAAALLLPSLAGAAQDLETVVRHLEATYTRLQDLKAEFHQVSVNKGLNQTIQAEGTLYLKRPGKLRWEFRTPTRQEIVSDGQKLWVHTPDLKQVNVADAPRALAGPAGSFLAGLGRLRESFTVRFLNPANPTDEAGRVVLDLTPKQPEPSLARLILAVDPGSWLVRKAVVYDQFGNTVTLTFTRVSPNPGLPDSLFTFTPPPGTAVVPMPSAPGSQ